MPSLISPRLRDLFRPLFGVALLAAAPFVFAEERPSPEELAKIRLSNDECLRCHSEAGLKNPPQRDLDLAKLKTMIYVPAVYDDSDHGETACIKCHKKGYVDYPHADDAKESLAECQDCHAKRSIRIERQFEKSVHAKNLSETFTCAHCHDAHTMKIAAKLGDPRKIVAQDNQACLNCHDSDEKFAKLAPEDEKTKKKKVRPKIDQIHEWLPNTKLHWQAVRCVECHTPTDEKIQSHEILDKKKAEKNCVTCHSAETALKTRLYRHLAKEEQNEHGFLNSIVLRNSYVVGATRNAVLDRIVIGFVAFIFFAAVLHGLIRVIAAFLRRKKS
jgi:Cytochrome c7 and related cytochrome c